MLIKILTRDNFIWDEPKIWLQIAQAMHSSQNLILDFVGEGPDLDSLNFYHNLTELVEYYKYNASRIEIKTRNILESHAKFKINKSPPHNFLNTAKTCVNVLPDKNCLDLLHFGIFVGRSNAARLLLAAHVFGHHRQRSMMSFHYNAQDDWHRGPNGLEDIVNNYGIMNLGEVADLLQNCPLRLQGADYNQLNDTIVPFVGHDIRLLNKDQSVFFSTYRQIFLEIVCESYYTGNTFFPTEKTWRPMLLKTPVIVQGPQNFLNNLKRLGFKTFDKWWDESYSNYPANYQIIAIKDILDSLSKLSPQNLTEMYQDMQPVLEHNYQRAMQLTERDWNIFNHA